MTSLEITLLIFLTYIGGMFTGVYIGARANGN